jgi:ABC-type nickel/cobalt efflux system permease component RcnA
MFIEIFSVIGGGFFLGLYHSFEPDHVAAMATFSIHNSSFKESVRDGFRWGVGHSAMLLLAGIILLLFKIRLFEKISILFELIVGGMLILLGLRSFILMRRKRIHIHRHHHGSMVHTHFHSHISNKHHQHSHYPFLAGLVQGLAGSGPLIILVLFTIPTLSLGIMFILMFGIGSIIGMALVSGITSFPLMKLRKYNLQFLAGLISLVLGIKIFIGGVFKTF